MPILDNIMLALGSLKANKMRALLTMLGIIIGIGSVIGIVTVGESMTGSFTDEMASFGANNITVSLVEKKVENSDDESFLIFGPSEPSSQDLISPAMLEEYQMAYGHQIKAIGISEMMPVDQAKFKNKTAKVSFNGVSPGMQEVENVNMLSGRFIKDSDLLDAKNICVISDMAAKKLYGTTFDIIGNTLDVNVNGTTQTFYVVGVYEYSKDIIASLKNNEFPTPVYVPLSTAKQYNHSPSGYQSFTVLANPGSDTNALAQESQSFFASFYNRNNNYTVEASSLQSVIDSMAKMMGTMTMAISAIAAISLLVGGIGVMNIMLVSITERTREIGTRKALGASEWTIRMQFIIESVVICIIGGILGIAVGLLLGYAGANALGYGAKPSLATCALAVGFSMTIGIFFGYYPASKAAKLDPIEALRYE
ncbi:MAG: ABC transporter permease [Erysipelotrichaceae bacterium]|nr:ABC transporter permease [Erysipelotrichaceae bacterium]MDY5251145.1 ABC transporter permease [Erysipelotrichaceae bacterium]